MESTHVLDSIPHHSITHKEVCSIYNTTHSLTESQLYHVYKVHHIFLFRQVFIKIELLIMDNEIISNI